MTSTHLTLSGVSYALPDGRALFSELDFQFDGRPTGLVGANGVGKTVLARLLAGELAPTRGLCRRDGPVRYLTQQVRPAPGERVADLMGWGGTLDALLRIEAGTGSPADFERVGPHWDLRARLRAALTRAGLSGRDLLAPAATLSGGEAMRAALAGALAADAAFLILDEPSNHLDRDHRAALLDQLAHWPRGLLVISHDRMLLDRMARIVELSPQGLRAYGGNFTFYRAARDDERAQADQALARARHDRQLTERRLRAQQERQAQRTARGRRLGHEANQARILLDRQKGRSESTEGRLARQHAETRARLAAQVRDAAGRAAGSAGISVHALPAAPPGDRVLATLDAVVLPHVQGPTRELSLAFGARQRIGLVGANGRGKSTLMKVLGGQLAPRAGMLTRAAPARYLDQRLGGLDPARSALAQLRQCAPGAREDALRTRLVHLGLDAARALAPCGQLSGGEQLKAALACALYAEPAPAWLLLDEPGNHLDLPSLAALESALLQYRGALMVASHDEALLQALDLSHRLEATDAGWRFGPW
ncbi:ATP-binding cassette domain-containing protein [Bordetella genomosp. 1]|uniref:ABC transporter ATP-binding protein n=1 Tax=Bordetella genomosp. 1 TaxID=1395607 RepID=A0ABX4EXD7_9BORD|nr:ATP-binding cassette domain-containing protein [Bordetella genomosp. 1]OZI63748.1 ABC transporter ATP-binding protein [Bordetella genomosp. 1]